MSVNLQSILQEFREIASFKRDLRTWFKRLMLTHLRKAPPDPQRFDNVWMWMDWPERHSKPDTGINLMAWEQTTGDYCAIQDKFYDPNHYLDKRETYQPAIYASIVQNSTIIALW
jgi:predicted helicase